MNFLRTILTTSKKSNKKSTNFNHPKTNTKPTNNHNSHHLKHPQKTQKSKVCSNSGLVISKTKQYQTFKKQ